MERAALSIERHETGAPARGDEFDSVYAIYRHSNHTWHVGVGDKHASITMTAHGKPGESFDVVLDAAIAELQASRKRLRVAS